LKCQSQTTWRPANPETSHICNGTIRFSNFISPLFQRPISILAPLSAPCFHHLPRQLHSWVVVGHLEEVLLEIEFRVFWVRYYCM
jgi:hypothetical protein